MFFARKRELAPSGDANRQRDNELDAIISRLNHFETRLEQVELMKNEQHLMTLNAVEKVMHQLQARERKRRREAAGDNGESTEPEGETSTYPTGSAHLAHRFRRF